MIVLRFIADAPLKNDATGIVFCGWKVRVAQWHTAPSWHQHQSKSDAGAVQSVACCKVCTGSVILRSVCCTRLKLIVCVRPRARHRAMFRAYGTSPVDMTAPTDAQQTWGLSSLGALTKGTQAYSSFWSTSTHGFLKNDGIANCCQASASGTSFLWRALAGCAHRGILTNSKRTQLLNAVASDTSDLISQNLPTNRLFGINRLFRLGSLVFRYICR